ncbi:MAG TPA: helix-turn-helix transcriptional regulator [Porphyromonadaceae bacterium]|jgi:iron-sulfur cluster repair protein YtfE (RIC family)|nr:helix-turn-helix transcriptional regulator [Porphyromonadaceae bacterium]HAM94599.1 helix-turn-helix transcriptional regulator [Porphyromonadaceae bacterium]
MALVTPDTKLCEVIVDEPSVVPVINRFDIVLGVGDRTIKSICKEKGIDTSFFITILNAFINESFFLENVTGAFNAGDVVDYLRKTNNSYLRNQLPNIERHFAALISRSDSNNNLPLLFNFYREVKTEIERRIDSDNQWFDAIISAEQSNSEVSVAGNAVQAESDSIEDKLSDLINMFVIHLRGDYDRNLCHAVLFAVISLEKDICQNNRIRNRVLRPLVDALNSRNS